MLIENFPQKFPAEPPNCLTRQLSNEERDRAQAFPQELIAFLLENAKTIPGEDFPLHDGKLFPCFVLLYWPVKNAGKLCVSSSALQSAEMLKLSGFTCANSLMNKKPRPNQTRILMESERISYANES